MPYILAIILYTIFLVVPGISNPLDGVPLDTPHEIGILAIALPILLSMRPLTARVSRLHILIIPLIIGKILLGTMGLMEGLAGTYHVYDIKNPPERSTEFIHMPQGATRFDRELSFVQAGYAENARPMPLWFLNDSRRFTGSSTEKASLPIFIEWSGYLYVPAGTMTIGADSDGTTEISVIMPKKENVVPITVRYAASTAPNRSLKLFWNDANKTPVTGSLYAKPYTVRAIHVHYFLKLADGGLKAMALALFVILIAIRPAIHAWKILFASTGVVSFLFFAERLMRAARSPYFNMLGGGNDPLAYETYARYLQFTGNWSMAAIEQGSYYYQPYYYFITLLHYIGGEGLLPILFMQGALLVAAGMALGETGRRMTNTEPIPQKAWPFALIAPALVLMPQTAGEASALFPSIFGIFFASLTALLLILRNASKNKEYVARAAGGVAFGLGIMNRFNFLSWLPLIILWALFQKRGIKNLLFFIAGSLVIIGPILARNHAIAGQIRIFSRSNATINFIKSAPPAALHYAPKNIHPRLNTVHDTIFDSRATPIMQWIAENPALYIRHTLLKAKDTAIWLSWPLVLFIIASGAYLAHASRGRRADYILMGLFPLIQIVTVIILSDNSMRYHLPALSFMIAWSALLIAMLQSGLTRIMNKRAA